MYDVFIEWSVLIKTVQLAGNKPDMIGLYEVIYEVTVLELQTGKQWLLTGVQMHPALCKILKKLTVY